MLLSYANKYVSQVERIRDSAQHGIYFLPTSRQYNVVLLSQNRNLFFGIHGIEVRNPSIFTGVIEEDACLNATIIDILVPRKYHTDSSVFNIFDFVTRPFCSSLSHPPTPFPLVDMFLKHAFWR